MKTKVDHIHFFEKLFDPGVKCPSCLKWDTSKLLSTLNEWKYWCKACDIRFNTKAEIMK